eukprot:c29597_g1_i1 orf=785-952(+)
MTRGSVREKFELPAFPTIIVHRSYGVLSSSSPCGTIAECSNSQSFQEIVADSSYL